MPLVVAVTGGIGCGKSTVTSQFAALGAAVLDTDNVARVLTEAGQPATREIASALGPDLLDSNGVLDRARLRARVFEDTKARGMLEAILHPPILAEARRFVSTQVNPYCLVVVPLLFEKPGYRDLAERVLAVDCSVQTQIERVSARPGITEVQARAIIAAQVPRAIRLQLAQDLICNVAGIEALAPQVRQLHERYLSIGHESVSPRPGPLAARHILVGPLDGKL